MNLINSPWYKRIFKDAWSYWTGAILLATLNTAMVAISGKGWGVTTTFAYWGAWILQLFGADVSGWDFFQLEANSQALGQSVFTNTGSVQNIGIIVGALLATLLASQFKIKKLKSYKQFIAAALGGLLMGYGARIAFGCNIGAFFSGIASMSVHGWVYAVFIFLGAWIGSKLLVRYFIT
ncbi:MAG: uncharacterized protein PWQ93_166 [Clostridiales bacterium]|nr:uncharacterized protein [Clostridiales bacterium]